MFSDTTEPTEILHYVYLNVRFFPIDFPTENVVLCHYRKLNHVYSYGYLVASECCFLFLKIMINFLVSTMLSFYWSLVFFATSNELHQNLCIMALVMRWSSLASKILSIRHQVAIDSMFLYYAMTYLRLLSLSIAFGKWLMWMVIIWMSWTLTSPNTCDT